LHLSAYFKANLVPRLLEGINNLTQALIKQDKNEEKMRVGGKI